MSAAESDPAAATIESCHADLILAIESGGGGGAGGGSDAALAAAAERLGIFIESLRLPPSAAAPLPLADALAALVSTGPVLSREAARFGLGMSVRDASSRAFLTSSYLDAAALVVAACQHCCAGAGVALGGDIVEAAGRVLRGVAAAVAARREDAPRGGLDHAQLAGVVFAACDALAKLPRSDVAAVKRRVMQVCVVCVCVFNVPTVLSAVRCLSLCNVCSRGRCVACQCHRYSTLRVNVCVRVCAVRHDGAGRRKRHLIHCC